jgi:hypothetical protein
MTKHVNLQERFAAALLARGYRELSMRSRKFRAFEAPDLSDVVYLGRGGAVRHGRTVTESVPVVESLKAKLLVEADRLLAAQDLARG